MKLKFSLIIALLLSIVIPLTFGFYFLASYAGEQHKNRVQESLEAISQLATLRIMSSVDRIKEASALVSSRTQLRRSLQAYQQDNTNKPLQDAGDKHLNTMHKILLDASLSITNIVEISLYDNDGVAIASTLDTLPKNINVSSTLASSVGLAQREGQTIMTAYDPLTLSGASIGLIKVSVKPDFIKEIIEEGRGLGKSGEWVVAIKNEQGNAVFVSPTRYDNKGAFNRTIDSANTNVPVVQALAGNDGVMWNAIDYAGNEVVAATRFIPEFEWGIVAKINKEEVFSDEKAIASVFWMVLALTVGLALLIGVFLAYFIAKPIENLTTQVIKIRAHRDDYTEQNLQVATSWLEVSLLAQRFNEMLNDIRELNKDLNKKVEARTAELAATNNKLMIEKDKAEAATKTKSVFLANMSHELRTPLNSIYGSLQLLARESIDDKSKNLVTTASYSMESLLGIINDILDISKIEDDAIELENTYFSFTHIAKQVIAEMQVFADKKSLAFTFEKAPTYEEGWLGDALRIKQILINLVSNAIKFTNRGFVTIEFGNEHVDQSDYLVFKVKDSGEGMSQDFIDKLFDRFSQADSSTTRKFGGTGLGMPISLGLVKLMGGEIDVISKPDDGTSIVIKIPLEKAQQQDSKLRVVTEMLAPNLSNKTILLAEDNEINQVIFCAMLEDTNANVVLAGDGKQALEMFKEIQPDMVFLDIQMPVMDGLEACKAIRALSDTIPLISITANIAKEDTLQYEAVGFNHQVGKPVDLKSLYNILSIYA